MATSEAATEAKQVSVGSRWNPEALVSQVLAGEALLTYVGDQVFLTFGQIQVPPSEAGSVGPGPWWEYRPWRASS